MRNAVLPKSRYNNGHDIILFCVPYDRDYVETVQVVITGRRV